MSDTPERIVEPPADDAAQRREEQLLREHGVDPDDPALDREIRRLEAGATEARPYGRPGEPIFARSPFRTALQATLGVLCVVVVTWTVYAVGDIVLMVVVALFLAIGLSPAVEYLRRRGLGPRLAPTIVAAVVLAFAAATVLAGLPPLLRQGNDLREQIPQYARQAVSANATLRDLDERFGLVERVEGVTEGDVDSAGLAEPPPELVLGLAMGMVRIVFATVTTLVLTIYFLGNYRRIKRGAYALVPRSRRARATLLSDEILDRVGLYVLGNIATSVVAGTAATLVLWWLDVPYPVALGLFVGLMDAVPLVGATIGAVVSSAIAFTVSAGTGVLAIVFFILYQQFENFVLVPRVMRHAVDVSAAATIVAILIGAALLGIVGALLAVPVAAGIQLVFTEVVLPRQEAA